MPPSSIPFSAVERAVATLCQSFGVCVFISQSPRSSKCDASACEVVRRNLERHLVTHHDSNVVHVQPAPQRAERVASQCPGGDGDEVAAPPDLFDDPDELEKFALRCRSHAST